MKKSEAQRLIYRSIVKAVEAQTNAILDDWRSKEDGTHIYIDGDGTPSYGAAAYSAYTSEGGGKYGAGFNSGGHKVVEGKDLSDSYNGSYDIKAVLKAQGYDGVPLVVSDEEEFNKLVEDSSFIAQRTYAASDEATLREYQDMLYDGEFYVDCTKGGAQYGKGMYCAADYNGELTEGIEEEMEHYRELGQERYGAITDKEAIEALTLDDVKNYTGYGSNADIQMKLTQKDLDDYKSVAIYELDLSHVWTKKEIKISDRLYNSGIYDVFEYAEIDKLDELSANYQAPVQTETLTLDKSAKVITYDEITSMKRSDEKYSRMDTGAYAALKGYDAINAEGHGRSGSYTVVLNRTKMAIKDDRIVAKAAHRMTFEPDEDGRLIAYRDGKEVGWVQVYGTGSKADEETKTMDRGQKNKRKKKS